MDRNTSCTIMKCHSEHHGEEDYEQERCQDKTHPCLMPLITSKSTDISPFSTTAARMPMPSWNERMMLTKLGGQPIFSRTSQRAVLSTESKAFVRSTKTTYNSRCCSRHFSWSCRAVKIMFMVPRPLRKPHWLSRRMLLSLTCLTSRLKMTRASILPGMENSEIPRWSSQTDLSPFRLKMCTIKASLNSWGTVSLLQMDSYSVVSLLMISGLPDLNSSGGTPSGPGAFPEDIWLTARWTSWLSGGRISPSSVSQTGNSDRTEGSNVVGWLRTPRKCSAQRDRIPTDTQKHTQKHAASDFIFCPMQCIALDRQ